MSREIEQLINYIKSEYPRYNYLNENTNISNIHLYKLIEALETHIIK